MTASSEPMGQAQELSLRERKKREVRLRIRSSALQLFFERGFEHVSIDEIAAAAHVSRSTFFNYFATKDAVITWLDEESTRLRRSICDARPLDEPLWDSITAVILNTIEAELDAIRIAKRLRDSSSAVAEVLIERGNTVADNFLAWVLGRAPQDRAEEAEFELKVAMTAVSTALEQWDESGPVTDFVDLVRGYLGRLRPSFV